MAFGEKNRVTYSKEHREQAKNEQLALITLDVDKGALPAGSNQGHGRFTMQGCSRNAHLRMFLMSVLCMLDELHPELAAAQQRLHPTAPLYVRSGAAPAKKKRVCKKKSFAKQTTKKKS